MVWNDLRSFLSTRELPPKLRKLPAVPQIYTAQNRDVYDHLKIQICHEG